MSKMQAFESLAYETNVTYVTFKTQVQEWKNILLRGFNAEDYDKYHSAFIEKREEVQNQLENLLKNAEQVGVDKTQIVFLKTQHKELIDLADIILTDINLQDTFSIRASDKQIRGKDRPLGDAFEKFAKEIKTISDQSKKDLIHKIEETIHTLKNVLWAIIILAFILLFLMTVLILKSERKN
ncbi:MAG: hypothetical protein ACKOW3_05295 [Hyphomicrobium sp.]